MTDAVTSSTVAARSPWAVDARTVVFGAIGAALYAVLGQFQVVLPGTQSVSIRPAFALVMFVAFAFGPIAGAFAGVVGNAVLDQISGWGLTTSWNWSVANGLAAFVFGALVVTVARSDRSSFVKVALLGSIGVAIGFLFVITDIWIGGIDFSTFLTANYGPVVLANVIAVAVLTPILVRAWEPLAERIGR